MWELTILKIQIKKQIVLCLWKLKIFLKQTFLFWNQLQAGILAEEVRKEYPETTRCMLRKIIAVSLAKTLNCAGKGEKRPAKDLHVVRIIVRK